MEGGIRALQLEQPLQISLDDWVTLTLPSLCKRAQKTTDDTNRLFLAKALLMILYWSYSRWV